MFEITYNDKENLEMYKECGKAYRNGEYDFTFENRFIIYNALLRNKLEYIALDTVTGQSSHIVSRNSSDKILKENYRKIITDILYSIKYTGDTRYKTLYDEDPVELIDTIFRVVLPANRYKIREEQIRLSKKMFYGFTEKQIAICEAEVGTGKTLAYLVAAFAAKIYYEKNYNISGPITISTATVELQKNLVEKEIPNLSKMLEEYQLIKRPFITVLRKGKEHYFCPFRLETLEKDLKENLDKHRDLLEILNVIKNKTYGIDLDKYAINGSIKSRICVKGSCSGCKVKDTCPYNKMIKTAMTSPFVDFQVTNHNMYLMSQKNKKNGTNLLLQKSSFVVLDEAHRIKEIAEEVFGETLCEKDIMTYITNVKTSVADKNFSKEYKKLLSDLFEENINFFNAFKTILETEEIEEDTNMVIELSKEAKETLNKISALVSKIELHKSKNRNGLAVTGEMLIKTLRTLSASEKNITWIKRDENGVFSLCCSPCDINNILWERVWDCNSNHVLTSGTMSDGNDFEYFKTELGIDKANQRLVLESITNSPFDYANHTRLYLPYNMPLPDNGSEAYIAKISKEILNIIQTTNGHTAILFTSYKVLQAVYKKLELQLSKYNVICMTRGNKSAISKFKKADNGVLFASGAMWEGVDCIGDCLSSVIIVRLPFPMRNAVTEVKKTGYKTVRTFVDDYCVPSMLIKLRQGVGRLIRSETDTGLISILDPRVMSDIYSDKVLCALDKYPVIETLQEAREFLEEVKTEKYFKCNYDSINTKS